MREFVPAPKLDDRTFDELIDAARARAVRYMPEWTDYNASDPGTTLLELFAWFTELMLYRYNQVPELHRRKFLDMLGMSLRPAQPAQVQLVFEPSSPNTDAVVPAGTRVAGASADGDGQVFFETLADLQLIPHRLDAVRVFDGSRYRDHTRDHEEVGGTFATFGEHGVAGSALYVGFRPPKQRPGQPPARALFPDTIKLYVRGGTSAHGPGDGEAPPPPPEVDLVWEYRSANELTPWIQLRTLEDDTQAFLRDGPIEIEGPPLDGPNRIAAAEDAEFARSGAGSDDEPDNALFWLRCRIRSGTYPPRRAPSISRIQYNTVRAGQWLTVRDEELGTGSGHPGQRAQLLNKPVLPGTLGLRTIQGDQETTWKQVDDLHGHAPDAAVYVLDEASGRVLFGDGLHGAVPAAGCRLLATRYRFGGGSGGNVRPGAIAQILESVRGVKRVTNPDPAFGGKDAEDVDELVRRAPQELRRRSRAVTPEDFESLVLDEVGGVAMARALPLVHPSYPGIEVPGAITVVVVPDWDFSIRPKAPELGPTLRDFVHDLLDERRLVGTELHVVGPQFASVSVRAVVRLDGRRARPLVEQDVRAAIRRFLVPHESSTSLSRDDAASWQLGAKFQPELMLTALLRVEGVANVRGFAVELDGHPLERDAVEELPPHELLWDSGAHTLDFQRSDGSATR